MTEDDWRWHMFDTVRVLRCVVLPIAQLTWLSAGQRLHYHLSDMRLRQESQLLHFLQVGHTPAQRLFAAPASASTNPFPAPAASSTETSKPAPFPFAKSDALPSSTPASTSTRAYPPSIFGAPSSNAAPSGVCSISTCPAEV